jgi:hypothetical protein
MWPTCIEYEDVSISLIGTYLVHLSAINPLARNIVFKFQGKVPKQLVSIH